MMLHAAGFGRGPRLAGEKERHERGAEEECGEPSSCRYRRVTPHSTRLGVDVRVVLDFKYQKTKRERRE